MTPEVLDTSDEFVFILKWYANLNFALFSDTLALFRSLVKVIHSIKAFSWVDRNSMTLKTKASIIWIILLQSRKFYVADTTILAELFTMHTNLSSKKCLIIHAEVTNKIFVITQRKRTRDFDPVTDPIPNKYKGWSPQGKFNPNTWHTLLKSKLTSPIEVSGKPSLKAVLK